MSIKEEKSKLRKKIIRLRDELSPVEIIRKSQMIGEKLFALPAYCDAAAVMFFLTFGSEVDTRPMVEETFRRGKVALAPKTLSENRELIPSKILDWDKDLSPGAYNIPEPKQGALRPYPPEKIDLLIVPGVAFDSKKRRLGYGGGYYDRFFERLKEDTPLIALAFELQILSEIPSDQWDRRVDLIITEDRVINHS
ncbi:MAG: 5-formyltetrahydrofolate cyclo-ligase [Bacillota bacterium]